MNTPLLEPYLFTEHWISGFI